MTYYWLSGGIALVGVLLLVAVGLRMYRSVRTFNTVRSAVQGIMQGELGLLKARRAALNVRILDRKAPVSARES